MAGPIPQIPVQEDGPDLSASHSKHSRVLAVGSQSQIPATLSGGSFLNEHTFLCFMNEGKREWNSCPLGRVRFLPLCTQPAAVVTAWAWQRFWECCCSGKCILEKKMKEIERERLRCRELGCLDGAGRVYPAWRQLQGQWWSKTALEVGGEILLLPLPHISSSRFHFIYYVFNKGEGVFLALSIESGL